MLTKLGAIFRPVWLWNYRRGAWQYDLICASILAFIFLTPQEFFGDQPRPAVVQQVQRLTVDGATESVYWVDAAVLGEVAPEAANGAIEALLRKRREEHVRVISARPEAGPDGTVAAYLVRAGQ